MTQYPLTVFFDGACPICDREIALMKRLDRRRQLEFCDFSNREYNAASSGFTAADLGTVIHARWADGSVITGVEVFRAMWEAIGLGVLARLSRLSLVEPLVLRTYAWFARNRLRLTGRLKACTGDACASHPSNPIDVVR
jgi:predicted DCC family thiol-disulfide oxidoreductase YuxK